MFVESSNADEEETVELVDLLSSSILLRIESSELHPSLTLTVNATSAVDVFVVVVDVDVGEDSADDETTTTTVSSFVFSLKSSDLEFDGDLLGGFWFS
jgi:hypothetical protein